MTEKIIALRSHHIDRFVNYYYGFMNMFDNPTSLEERYGSEMVKELKEFYDMIASGGTGEEYILVISQPDFICDMCKKIGKKSIKRETCSEPDSLSVWNGSGQVMEDMDLREGWLYPINEFLDKLKQLYPGRIIEEDKICSNK